MPRINPNWIEERKAEVEKGFFTSVVTSYNPAAQWLVTYLANRDKPVHVTNLGAGVKRITLAENVCPHCKGKGYTK
uniref:Uncharacterized protein n=1 Tax=viral metagenome TaxID=1070528 RepID=A0A6H1ZD63_9ZZZZ